MDKKIGFIGGGNMARAMIGGILKAGLVAPENIMASARTEKSVDALKTQFQIKATPKNEDVAKFADILFLAVKPYVIGAVIEEIKDIVSEDMLIVSIAAGQTLAAIEQCFNNDEGGRGKKIKAIRVMPNTPALVGEAMSALCGNESVDETDMAEIVPIFESFGKCEIVPEKLMDAVTGVSGSSPAYVYMFIEAMADAAVADGMPRAQAYKFAAQSVLGAAKMVLESGKHPGELKDAVCSPAGTTIEAVDMLEENGFRGIVMKAQRACSRKSREMSKSK